MSEKSKSSSSRVEVFSNQPFQLQENQNDVDVVVIHKQELKFQNLSVDSTTPSLTVQVNSDGRTRLHYVPETKVAGERISIKGPDLCEIWFPRPVNENTEFLFSGISKPFSMNIPSRFINPADPMYFMYGELPGFTSKPSTPAITPSSMGKVPPGLEDLFITVADTDNTLVAGEFREGLNRVEDLREKQKGLLEILLLNTISNKNLAGAAGQVIDNFGLLSDFARGGRFYIKITDGKYYVIFKGYPGLRRIYTSSRYRLDKNFTKFSMLTIAQGVTPALKSAIPRLSKGSTIGLLWVGSTNTYSWLQEDEKFLSDLLIQMGSDIVKAVASTIAAALIIAIGIVFTGTSLAIFTLIIGTIFFGFAIGMGLDIIDNWLGVTDIVKKYGRKISAPLAPLWRSYIDEPLSSFLQKASWEVMRIDLRSP